MYDEWTGNEADKRAERTLRNLEARSEREERAAQEESRRLGTDYPESRARRHRGGGNRFNPREQQTHIPAEGAVDDRNTSDGQVIGFEEQPWQNTARKPKKK